MRHDILAMFLSAGPARKFDIGAIAHRRAQTGHPRPLLFNIPFLNTAVLFKQPSAASPSSQQDETALATIVYIPNEAEHPGNGGDTFIYSEQELLNYYRMHAASEKLSEDDLQQDIKKLAVLDAIPNFSPFVVELAFRQAGILLPEGTVEVPPGLQQKMAAHLQVRLQPLIIAALRGSLNSIERAVAELTNTLLSLRTIEDIRPLIVAMRLPPEKALAMLSAWIGTTFYEFEFAALQPTLATLGTWLTICTQAREPMESEEQNLLAAEVTAIQNAMRGRWDMVVAASTAYRSSYDSMVFNGQPEPFRKFLAGCPQVYRRLGDTLERLEQIKLVWKHFVRRYPDARLPYAELREFFGIVRPLVFTTPSIAAYASLPGPG